MKGRQRITSSGVAVLLFFHILLQILGAASISATSSSMI